MASDILLPVQSRMARAALDWSLDSLAAASGVNRKTILRFEREDASTREASLRAIRKAFEEAGVRFVRDGAAAGALAPSN
jgi:transcriptional regulator with XRE-family HTH domain